MPSSFPPFAIAFYRTKIDFFERNDKNHWSLKDRIKTPTLSGSAIEGAFSKASADWHKKSRKIIVGIPQSLSAVMAFDQKIHDHELALEYYKKFSCQSEGADSALLFAHKVNDDQSMRYLILQKAYFDDVCRYVENYNFKVAGVFHAPGGNDIRNPTIIPVQKLKPLKLPPISMVSKEAQLDEAAPIPPFEDVDISDETVEILAEEVGEDDAQPTIALAIEEETEPFETIPPAPAIALDQGENAAHEQGSIMALLPNGQRAQIAMGVVGVFCVVALLWLLSRQFLADDFSDRAENDQTAAVQTAQTPTNTPTNPLEVALKNQSIDASVQFETTDVKYRFRPSDHAEFAEAAEASLPNIVYGKPDFRTYARPSDHGEYLAKILGSKITVPTARDSKKVIASANRIEALATANPKAAPSRAPQSTAPSFTDLPPISVSGASSGQIATSQNAINLKDIALLGIFGQKGRPSALIRSSGGRTVQVNPGDQVDGWKIVAISRSEVIMAKSGNQKRLHVPN